MISVSCLHNIARIFGPKVRFRAQNETEGGQKQKIVNINENIQIRELKLHQYVI